MAKQNHTDQSLKLLARTSLIVLIGLFASKILGYLYRIVIARYYGPEIYGIFALAIMVAGLFTSFSSFGLSEGVLRFISIYRGKKQTNKLRYIFNFSLYLALFLSLISGILLFFFSSFISIQLFHNPEIAIFLKIFSILIPTATLFNVFISTIKAFEKIGWYSFIFYISQNVVKLLFLGFFIFLGLNGSSVAVSWLLGTFSMLFFSYFVCKYKIPQLFLPSKLGKEEKRELRKKLISYSWPVMFFTIISSFLYWIDSFSIGYFRSVAEVGFYNAAVPLAMLLGMAPEIFIQLFFPLITKHYARKNIILIKDISKQVGKWIFIINLPLFILIMLFPGAFINLFFGKDYLVAINALRFLAIGSFFSSVFIISNNLVSMAGKSKIILIDIILASALNVILNILLVPKYSINGAAFSTMLCFIFLYTLFLFQANKYLSIIPLKRKMLNIFFVALFLSLILYIIRFFINITFFSLVLLSFLFFLSYIILIFLTNCLDEKDKMIIKELLKNIPILKYNNL